MEEHDAIRRCQGGDKESFRPLVEAYKDRAFRAACRILHDPGAAEEAVQDAYLSAWRGIHTFECGRPFWPWLCKLVVRAALKRLPSVEVRSLGNTDPALQIPDQRPTPYGEACTGETTEIVHKALEKLTPQRRLLLTLQYYHELEIREMAELTGLPEGTVKSEIHRAKQDLKPLLKGVLGNAME